MCIWTYPWRQPDEKDYFGPVINFVFEDVKLDKFMLQKSEAFFTSERHITISCRMTDDTIKNFKLNIYEKSDKALSELKEEI
jgi:hypothetical protein